MISNENFKCAKHKFWNRFTQFKVTLLRWFHVQLIKENYKNPSIKIEWNKFLCNIIK